MPFPRFLRRSDSFRFPAVPRPSLQHARQPSPRTFPPRIPSLPSVPFLRPPAHAPRTSSSSCPGCSCPGSFTRLPSTYLPRYQPHRPASYPDYLYREFPALRREFYAPSQVARAMSCGAPARAVPARRRARAFRARARTRTRAPRSRARRTAASSLHAHARSRCSVVSHTFTRTAHYARPRRSAHAHARVHTRALPRTFTARSIAVRFGRACRSTFAHARVPSAITARTPVQPGLRSIQLITQIPSCSIRTTS